ncbi:helix-turn-helix domain-containing protein [Streptomyces phaeochromogenes]|uniref:helix-turn-helix domain-containing protein n=1 Tax=Streptomyces phaeochromogenes TaxID=1923 RepID=UPI0036CFABCA
MCRPEKPITTGNKALRELAEWLRDQRERTRQGYRALSVRAGCHATTLQRATSGASVPKLQTVLNYARACDASPEEARILWKRARYEEARLARGGRGVPVPRPELIRDFVDLSAALQDLYEKAGSPALRTMEQRAGNFGVLPRSTAHRIVTKQAMPHSLQQFQAYLRACEVPETDWPDWKAAWTRAWRHEKKDDFATRSTATAPLQDVDVLAAIGIASDEILQDAARTTYTSTSTSTQSLREFSARADGEIMLSREGILRRMPVQRKRHEPIQLPRRRPVRVRPHLPEQPAPGQMVFAIAEPTPEPDALF